MGVLVGVEFWLDVDGLSGLTVGGGPSALRWMAARAEFAFV